MTVWLALLLGVVQGLCEFLPVSSSGHLVLLQNVFGIEEGALFFTTMLHFGTLIAVFIVYWRQIWAKVRHPIQKKVGMLLLATFVTTAIAFLFKDVFEASYGGGLLGFGFLLTAVILLITERVPVGKKSARELKIPGALGIGLMQGVAIFPGVSRSGSTIAGSCFFGLSRKEAADFSFLLSIPAILGSVVLEMKDVITEGVGQIDWLPVIVGVLAAAISGYFAIRLMLRVIKKKKLMGFAVYVAVLGVLVLLDQFVFHIFFANPF